MIQNLTRWRLPKQTLRLRLTLWYTFLLALTLVLFSGYLYLQLEDSLIQQLDKTLQVTASQNLLNLIEIEGHPAFVPTPETQIVGERLTQAGLVVRLLDTQGQIWDGLGSYHGLPEFLPTETGYTNVSVHSMEWRIYSQSLGNGNPGEGWIQVAESLQPVTESSEHLLTLILLGLPLVLLIATLGGLFLAQQALQPIDRIIRTAQGIGANDFSQRIGYAGVMDEVGRLAMTIDRMLDRLHRAFEHERRFTADAAHELRTPLTVIKGRIGVTLSRQRTPKEYISTLQDLEKEADRLIRLTNGLLFLAGLEQKHQDESFLERVDLSNLLGVLVEQMQPLAENQSIDWVEDIEEGLQVRGNPDYLTNLLLNLLDNALKYTGPGGRVMIWAGCRGDQVWVTVEDTGMGIPEQHLPYLFERFYRVEEARSRHTGGAGLGLAIAHEIARFHHGSLAVESQLQQGSKFILRLPAL